MVANLELRRRLCGILGADGELDIVAEANNAYSARDKIIECNPEVMLLCHDLPRMPGIVFFGEADAAAKYCDARCGRVTV